MKINKITYLILLALASCLTLSAQQETEINATNILFPRLTNTERNGISASEGMVIYNMTTSQFEYHNGTSWTALSGGATGSGDMIEDGIDNDTKVVAIENGASDYVNVEVEGSNTLNIYENKMLLNRTSTISSNESFGVRTEIASPVYGGMYVETNGDAGGKPFIGLAINGASQSWLYHDGATDELRFYNSGERFSISNLGAIKFNEAYEFPTVDGSNGQVLVSDGSGELIWGNASEIKDADGDTYIKAVENGASDYVEIEVESGGGTIQFREGPGGDIRMEMIDHSNSQNVFIGNNAGDATLSTGTRNTFIGEAAGSNNTSGTDNTSVGNYSGYSNLIGQRNTSLGRRAGYSNKDSDNTHIGHWAGTSSDNGEKNVFIGAFAGEQSEADFNVAIGYESGRVATSAAISNTFTGYQSGKQNTSGSHNSYFGQGTGELNQTGIQNTMIGSRAGESNTTNNNTFVGYMSGADVTTGGSNTFVGKGSGENVLGGSNNVFVGEGAGNNNVTGLRNVYIGTGAGEGLNSTYVGNDNVYIGYEVGRTAIESQRLRIANTGTGNPLIFGEFDNYQIGINNSAPAATLQIDGVSGDDPLRVRTGTSTQFMVHNNGRVNIGSASTPSYRFQLPNNPVVGEGHARATGWATYSDGRVKSNITPLHNCLEKILNLEPVSYMHHASEFIENSLNVNTDISEESIGFIAQDLKAIIPEVVYEPENENTSLWSVDYEKIIPVLVKAMQEQQDKIDLLESEILLLKEK
jgi:hypothetical protein